MIIPFTPVTVQAQQGDLTHTINDYVYADMNTLCGLDTSQWVGFDYTPPTCPTCQELLKGREIHPSHKYPQESI